MLLPQKKHLVETMHYVALLPEKKYLPEKALSSPRAVRAQGALAPSSLHCESMHWPDRMNSAVNCPSIFGLHAPAFGADFTPNCSD